MRRVLTCVAAAVYALLAVVLSPLLLHPAELSLTLGAECPAGYGWDDVAAYASLAVVVVLLVLFAVRLVRSVRSGGGPTWLLALAALPAVGLLPWLGTEERTCSSINFGFVDEPSPARAVAAAALGVALTVAVLRRMGGRGPGD